MCIFCKIVAGDIPCYKVYEDEKVLAFLDIKPVNPGDTLVISKNHYSNIEEAPEEILAAIISTVKRVGLSIKNKLGYSGYNVAENNDPVAGQVIPHLHFHVIPRQEGDGNEQWKQGEYGAGEAEKILEKLLA